ncbi:MAG TPA: SDR family NAD(P)-dependent oxidoreductase [Kofleriaceae bacterium]|nr:SDR family NAD(P)-dependent oxidoreductase [Kofleriaceae bacterium]
MGTRTDRKFAVITGASSGIGLELARQCAANDFDILVCAEDTAIHHVASSIDPRAVAVQANLATHDGIEHLVTAITGAGRPVDALLLNAGVGVGGRFIETDLDAELNMIALNCVHTVAVAKRIVPAMAARGQGRVLITGSVVSTSPAPYQAVYGATKAFVMSFGEALRYELKDAGVTVTVLQPGATDTDFFARGDMLDTKVGQAEKDDPALVAKRGFEAMMDGKDAVLGGAFKSRLQGMANEVLPETFKAKQVAKTSEPGSGKH